MKYFTLKLQIIALVILIISACNSGSSAGSILPDTRNYEEKKMSLEEEEKSDPLRFLSTEGTYRPKVFGKKFVIEGTIKNDATIATYKDVTIEFTYNSQTESVIGTDRMTIYEFFPPKTTKTFEEKIKAPEGTVTIGWKIVDAKNQ